MVQAVARVVKFSLTNETGFPRRYTCAAATPIYKNSVLTLSDPMTAASCALADGSYLCAGFASMDKDADDGSTEVSAWTDGIFKVSASGAILVGANLVSCGNGFFIAAQSADVIASTAKICGYALEAAAATETFLMRLCL